MMINDAREAQLTRFSILLTIVCVLALLRHIAGAAAAEYTRDHTLRAIEAVVFGVSVLFLVYGNLLYHWCRLVYHRRRREHVRAPFDELERIHVRGGPSLEILIPSYKEEPHVVWQTMLSAAFAEYPEKAVTLLIDDPPNALTEEDRRKLQDIRDLVMELQVQFDTVAAHFDRELDAFRARHRVDPALDTGRLAQLYMDAAERVGVIAGSNGRLARDLTHVDRFFATAIVGAISSQHLATARDLQRRLASDDLPDEPSIEGHYCRLAQLFHLRFSSFERKQYSNLSQESNKAMNLNSYIGLMGKSWCIRASEQGPTLEEPGSGPADLVVPAADYIITLDADSLLLPEYAMRLVHFMEQREHRDVAIVQTPYSAFPGAENPLERTAGATTDLQYIVHQGFTGCGATFWVGANALIRRRALEDIKETRIEAGRPVSVYIQDRTLIEDTESSIDLVCAGWRLHNYPERLAYSATPPDFGSLLIQRRRWANGGLLILPKLLRYVSRGPKNIRMGQELFMRFHYLASLAGGSAAMLLMFLYPFDDRLSTVWLPLSALPYFWLYARDLRLNGYRYSDVLRVYALNLALVPVIVGGVLKSLQQAVTGAKLPFGRTPKISSRSAAPPLYAALELMVPLAFAAITGWDLHGHRHTHAAFSILNGAFFGYALFVLLGVNATLEDALSVFKGVGGAEPVPAGTIAHPKRVELVAESLHR